MIELRSSYLLVAFALLTTPLSAAEPPDPLGKRISLDLVDTQARDVLASFGAMLPARVDLHPGVSGKLTVRLSGVSIRTVLDAVCDMVACAWSYEDGVATGPLLRVLPASAPRLDPREPGTLDTPVTMRLNQAPPRLVLSSLAEILGADLVLEWGETVTIDFSDEPMGRALDRVCARLGCEWQLDETVEPPRLRIRERSSASR